MERDAEALAKVAGCGMGKAKDGAEVEVAADDSPGPRTDGVSDGAAKKALADKAQALRDLKSFKYYHNKWIAESRLEIQQDLDDGCVL